MRVVQCIVVHVIDICSSCILVVITITDRMMALKNNGQEHNKLHLTISLDGSNASHGRNTEAPHVPMSATAIPVVPAEPVEESYMIMNSARTALSNAAWVYTTKQCLI